MVNLVIMKARNKWSKKWNAIFLISIAFIVAIVGFPTLWLVNNKSVWYAIPGFIAFFAIFYPWGRYMKRKAEESIES